MTQTITINDIAQRIVNEMNPHDSLIGILLEKYDLPKDGSAKEKEYDAPMIDILFALINDIQDRLEGFDTEYRITHEQFDENAKQWWSAWVDMYETLHSELVELEEQYDDAELSKREFYEAVYQNYHGCMESGYDGAKMIAMFASLGLGE